MNSSVKIIECPRDAMQGIKTFIPTQKKIDYINSLLKVGFDTIDFGSFVSPIKTPQMADTEEVLAGLDRSSSNSKLLAIVLNLQGAEKAFTHESIDVIGYPFSISETFQLRNTNKTILESIALVEILVKKCAEHNKELVIYVSMCFGNPYGDTYNYEIINYWVSQLVQLGVKSISLSDTVGVATNESIRDIFTLLVKKYPDIEIGAHFHTRPENSMEKIDVAYKAGCRRFDGAIKGFGGCPMAKDELVGNMPTEVLVNYFEQSNKGMNINLTAFNDAYDYSSLVF